MRIRLVKFHLVSSHPAIFDRFLYYVERAILKPRLSGVFCYRSTKGYAMNFFCIAAAPIEANPSIIASSASIPAPVSGKSVSTPA